MTTQLKPFAPDSVSATANILEPAPPRTSSPWRIFVRPLLLASILVHGAFLATPVPPETQATKPDIKDSPVTKTVSLKRPVVKSKPRSKTQASPKLQTKSSRPQRQQTSPRQAPQLRPFPQQRLASQKSLREQTPSKESRPDRVDSNNAQNNQSQNAKSTDSKNENTVPIENEEVETVFQALDQSLIKANESAYDYIPEPREFPEPEKFFTPESIQAFDLKSNPNLTASGGIINNPRYYRLKNPDEVLSSLVKLPVFKNAGAPKSIGDYGGGPVYEMKAGEKAYYINLVPARSMSKATFVVFWKWDPNKPQPQ
jgi:hypothetical protein